MAELLSQVIENYPSKTRSGFPIGAYDTTTNNIFITLFYDNTEIPMAEAAKVENYIKIRFMAKHIKTAAEDWNLKGYSLDGYRSPTGKPGSPKKRDQQPCPHPDEALKGLACLQLFSAGTLIQTDMSVAIEATHSQYPGYQERNLMEWIKKADWEIWLRATYHERLKVFYDHFDAAPYCIADKVFAGVKHGLDMEGIFGSKKDCSAEKRKIADDMAFTLRYHFGEYCEYAFWCILDGEDEKAKKMFTASVSTINDDIVNLTSRQNSLDWTDLPVRPFHDCKTKTPTTPDALRKPQTLKRARSTEENQRNAMSKRRVQAMTN
ncbi:hypothetical protein PRZ48_001800 [Zasmidium cellare]|uniref:Uncharacterized protein n=1 Tax=Zasmidium cellare TaxID=395010 RepID=A0ABR0F450_ZASCE|nr:hypothetical protein PRZ48_001800 [Zasmidium cellare]